MAWTSPRTWVALETVTASQLNTHLRDNLLETAPAKVTTQGDMIYATGANAITRLAKGTKFQQLQMNSGATAPQWGAAVQHALKTSNETVTSSATLQDDNELLVPVGTNEKWIFEVFLICPAMTPTIDIAFSGPSGSSGQYGVIKSQGGSPDVIVQRDLTSETSLGNVSGSVTTFYVWGMIATAGSAGNLTLRWAQTSSNASAATIAAGSMMRATRVA